ncbi:hypothetical protein QBC47DRAFT_398975 [Echria macrotheca]|uniref:Uncharacterized protein n=1 Tax=Echria macrotheca TaxID=438768 RepID=A0AAJ0FEE1_9PEZI|nr:hypothetical protein QBC47DRAFT_398975 [Echria macrotheca]
MDLPLLALVTISTLAMASMNSTCSGPEATEEWAKHGICMDKDDCYTRGGAYKDGACPGDDGSAFLLYLDE